MTLNTDGLVDGCEKEKCVMAITRRFVSWASRFEIVTVDVDLRYFDEGKNAGRGGDVGR